MSSSLIRTYKAGDEIAIARIFKDSILKLAAKDYALKQLAAWASIGARDDQYWRSRCEDKHPYVYEQDGCVIGFFELDTTGRIDAAYVNPSNAKQGVMSDLIEEAMRYALQNGIKRMYAEVPISAVPFFELHGFKIMRDSEVVFGDVSLKTYSMQTHLSPSVTR